MLTILRTRLRLGHQTIAYPDGPARFPARFRGRPALDASRCRSGCADCAAACPTEAVKGAGTAALAIDTGACLFCGLCQEACPERAIVFTRD
jgi:formate hydrogenlyase subunit 6/NADH:ubiquinone oxidoreductase subunit I